MSFGGLRPLDPTRGVAPGPHQGPLSGPLDPTPWWARAPLASLATLRKYFLFFLNNQVASLIFSCAHFSNFSCTQWHLKTQIPLFILVLNDPLLLKLCLLLISPCRRFNYHATMNVKNCIIWSIKPSLIVLLAPVLDISQGTWTSSSSVQKIPLSTILCQRQETQQEWHKGVPFSFYTSETKFTFGHILHMVCWISTKLRS